MSNEQQAAPPATTPLNALHRELGGRMVDFAGWDMPIQFDGVIAEHRWCRDEAGLFDVSHMTVIELWGDEAASGLERITPSSVAGLGTGRQRYGVLTNDDGGIVDDFIVTNWGAHLTVIANASRRDQDLAYLADRLPASVEIREKPEIALLALQGPRAAEVIIGLDPALSDTVFLDNTMSEMAGIQIAAGRSGYTGEDGFELAVAADDAERLARVLLQHEAVRPIGLGARDTLRLEAGLCLYGNDLDETTSPVEADLTWTIAKRRREAADFAGAERIMTELADGPDRRRVGIQPGGKRPVRDGAVLRRADAETDCGVVTSGGFGPSVDRPVAMGYVDTRVLSSAHSAGDGRNTGDGEPAGIGLELMADVRGKNVPCTVADLPFTPHRYRRRPATTPTGDTAVPPSTTTS